MCIKFRFMYLQNPQQPGNPQKYFAKVQVREMIDLNRIVEAIGYATSLTDRNVLNELRALIHKTDEHPADGNMVDPGDFGRFRYRLSSEGMDTKAELTPAQVGKVKPQFRPGSMWKPSPDHLLFEQVISAEERKEAKKKSKSN